MLVLVEEAVEALDRQITLDASRIHAGARQFERLDGRIGGEDLDLDALAAARDFLGEQHGERVRLLAARARRHPGANRDIALPPAHQRPHHQLAQPLPGGRIAKEASDVDHQIMGQRAHLVGAVAQARRVVGQGKQRRQSHAPLQTAQQGRFLVAAEIVTGVRSQERENPAQMLALALQDLLPARRGRALGVQARILHVLNDGLPDLPGRQYLIRVAGVDQARGHRRKFGALGRLREAQAPGGLDRPGARRAVRAHSGEHDCDRLLLLHVGQGAKEVIDRPAMAALLDGLAELEGAALESHREAGAGDVDMAGLQRQSCRHLQHRHGRVTREDLSHQAVTLRGQMLDDHERHAGFPRQSVEERVEGLDSPGRRADSHHRERQQGPVGEIIRCRHLRAFGG